MNADQARSIVNTVTIEEKMSRVYYIIESAAQLGRLSVEIVKDKYIKEELEKSGYHVQCLNHPHTYMSNGMMKVSWWDRSNFTVENYEKYLEKLHNA